MGWRSAIRESRRRSMRGDEIGSTPKRALVSGLVVLGVTATALALWELRAVVALLLLAVILACGMRPGVEALAERGVPRAIGVLAHFVLVLGLLGVGIAFLVPQLVHEARGAIDDSMVAARRPHGGGLGAVIRYQAVSGAASWLHDSASLGALARPAFSASRRAMEVLGGIAFVFACSAYWILDRERIRRSALARLKPATRAEILRTWDHVEQRLGSYVRGQLLLMTVVATTLSTAFTLIGLPYPVLLGVFAGLVEIVPIVGPLLAGVLAVGVGLTVSPGTAALAAAAVYGLRLVQDYVLVPRVIGHAVELPPLLTLIAVAVAGVVVGPALVPLATPFVAVVGAIAEHALRDGPSR
jgi:predicted PurR-regulated permease PerM